MRDAWQAGRRAKELHGTTLDDPAFGRITYDRDGHWKTAASLGPFGEGIEVLANAPGGEPPTDAQREAYEAFTADLGGFHRKIEALTQEFYMGVVLGTWRRQELEERPDEEDVILRETPDLDEPGLLWKWLRRLSVTVPRNQEGGWLVGLFWADCRWDEEHGWGIDIRNGEVSTGQAWLEE
jgi:hypothetical protein